MTRNLSLHEMHMAAMALLRRGERREIPPLPFGVELPQTQDGIRDVHELGKQLRERTGNPNLCVGQAHGFAVAIIDAYAKADVDSIPQLVHKASRYPGAGPIP